MVQGLTTSALSAKFRADSVEEWQQAGAEYSAGPTMMVLPADVPSRLQLLPPIELLPPREPLKPLPRSACLPSCCMGPPLLSLHQEQHNQSSYASQALVQPSAGREMAACSALQARTLPGCLRCRAATTMQTLLETTEWLQDCSGATPRLSIISCSEPLCCQLTSPLRSTSPGTGLTCSAGHCHSATQAAAQGAPRC